MALEVMGADPSGIKAAVAARLKGILGLKPQQTNLDAHKRKLADAGGDENQDRRKKPPPPPIVPKDEWVEYVSSANNKKYYYNTVTQETRWTHPNADAAKPKPPSGPPPAVVSHGSYVPPSSAIVSHASHAPPSAIVQHASHAPPSAMIPNVRNDG